MSKIFKDTVIGEIVYHASGKKLLQEREDAPGYEPPKCYLAGGERPVSGASDQQTVVSSGSRSPDETSEKGSEDRNLVTWDGPDDRENPRNWSKTKKAFVTGELCLLTFSIYIGSAIYSPGTMSLAMEFGVSLVAATLGLTLFVIGYGVGPLFLSPLSEIPAIGRNKPYLVTLFIFVLLQIGTARTNGFGSFCALRFFSGFFGSPPLATTGASLADMYAPDKRAYAIGIWGLAAVCGPVLGPLIGGFAGQALGWRWTIYPLLMLSGGSFIFLMLFLPETSADNILYRRAQRLRRVTGNAKLFTEGERMAQDMGPSDIAMMTLVRPIELMLVEPIVFLLNLYIAFVYALLYTWFESFPIVFVETYGFTLGAEGLAYFGIFTGAVLAYFVFCVYARRYLEPLFVKKNGRIDPEDRLPPALVGSVFLPICLFSFGWTATASIHWIVPIICSSFFGIGTFFLFQAVLNYLGDAYPKYAASVLAGNDFFRSVVGGAFPLFARAMFLNLQKNGPMAFPVSWGCTLLGGISLLLMPLPYIFYVYGAQIRKRSKYAASDGSDMETIDVKKKLADGDVPGGVRTEAA